jgi:hypothetical protein
MRTLHLTPVLLTVTMLTAPPVAVKAHAQGRGGGGRGGAPQTAMSSAPEDLTGYWITVVTEEWRYRMLTPPKGDYAGVALNPEGRKVADAWDPAKDEAAAEQCKAYGAPNIMRIPERLHITWLDEQTLKIETDAGMQTRLFYFGAPKSEGGDLQGVSKASWEFLPAPITSTDGARTSLNRGDRSGGTLKVVTTKLKPGYLRKNGVPYSANAVVSEYFDRVHERNGDSYLLVSTTVEDPTYLNQPLVTTTNFKKQADASGWNPAACSAR